MTLATAEQIADMLADATRRGARDTFFVTLFLALWIEGQKNGRNRSPDR